MLCSTRISNDHIFFALAKLQKIRGQVVVAALCISGVAITAIGNGASSVSADATTGAGLRFLGRWTSGSGLGGAEISAYDAASQRLFVTNGKTNQWAPVVSEQSFQSLLRPSSIGQHWLQ